VRPLQIESLFKENSISLSENSETDKKNKEIFIKIFFIKKSLSKKRGFNFNLFQVLRKTCLI